ncbi:MAG: TetR/AcrR family transcriptional regulator [Anaerolineae bacterium]|nr:TetR/AcrR family transcriptional regulator [Anaerolineae bacterium]
MSESRERVLQAAEQLFNERGYAAVTLRDIADALGVRQASLYYHVPGGKEALFIEVCEKGFDRHRAGLEEAIRDAGPEPRAQLRGAARWMLSQAMPDLGRMMNSDMPEIAEAHAHRLTRIAFESLLVPIAGIFERAPRREAFPARQSTLLAGAFISVIASVRSLPAHFNAPPKPDMADMLIDVFLYGLMPRQDPV